MSATFNTFDLIFMSLSLLFIVVAFFRGFVKEIFSLMTWIVALIVSYFAAPLVVKLLSSYSGNKMVLDIVSRTMLFIFTFFVFLISTSGLANDLKEKMPPLLDRSLGVFYGIIKSLIIFGAFYALVANLYGFLLGKKQDPDGKKVPVWMEEARFGTIIRISGEIIDPAVDAFIGAITKNLDKPGFLPKTLDDKIDETVEDEIDKNMVKDHSIDLQARPDSKSTNDKNSSESTKNNSTKKIEKETGYDKKNIDKLGRLIDVIDKTN